MAQAPTVTIASPTAGQAIKQGEVVNAQYTCAGGGVAECTGSVANGAPIPSTTIGPATFTVQAKNAAGVVLATASTNYSIVEAQSGDVGGAIPATLNMALGQTTAFSPFIPGLDRIYTAATSAQILSTAGDATLSVADASTTNTGKLVNGAYTLAQPVQVGAVKGSAEPGTQPAMAPLGGTAAPTTLLTYDGPVNESVALTYHQAIGATDALRTGAYSKTLVFTLSTTNP